LHYRLHPNQVSAAKGVEREEYAQIVEECWRHQPAMREERGEPKSPYPTDA